MKNSLNSKIRSMMEESEYEFYWCIINDSIEEYCHFEILIREFLKIFTKKKLVKVIEENYVNDETENRIDYLVQYMKNKVNRSEKDQNNCESVFDSIWHYYRYKRIGVRTYQIKYECKIVILVEMIKQGFL